MERMELDTGYDVYIGCSMSFDSLAEGDKKNLCVIDKGIFEIYGRGIPGEKIIVGPGERAKDISVITEIYDACMEMELGRDDRIAAVGGGAVGDTAGFAASTFKRGVSFINVPTTLLAMIDSCIGGKTAIDYKNIKNQIGTFYDPGAVYICTDFLRTLPAEEIRSAMGEVVKYAVLDRDFYDWLNSNAAGVCTMDGDTVEEMIRRCITIKAEIVAGDKLDKGDRACLNMGHTIGHAVELRYGMSHGLAVAAGIYYESMMAYRMGILSKSQLSAIQDLIAAFGLDTDIPIDEETLALAIHDKKNDSGKIGFILPKVIGSWEKVLLSREELKNLI